ncbi:hypothetical protein ES706_01418 [subsurface metagenome]
MSKTISWPARVTYILIALALALSLAGMTAVSADPAKESEWDDVSTPSGDDLVVTPGLNILDFDIGPDGEVIYAVVYASVGCEINSTSYEAGDTILLKSTDGGATWSDKTSKLLKENVKKDLPAEFDYLVQVAVAPNDEDFVIVAGELTNGDPAVVGSIDGATKFYYTGDIATVGIILCLDVSRGVDDIYNIAVGTSAGEVWRFEAGEYWGGRWIDATGTGYDGWLPSEKVTSVAFSPSWSADKTLLAISTNSSANKTWLQTGKWGESKGWGEDEVNRPNAVEFTTADGDPILPITVPAALGLPTDYHGVTGIALPSDYHGSESSLRRVYAYVNAVDPPGGYLFRIDDTSLRPSCGPDAPLGKPGPWFSSLAYHGDHDTGDAMVGMLGDGAPETPAFTNCCKGVQVWRTDEIDICCPDWKTATKKPSGQAFALVAFTPDGNKAYATTVGDGLCDESAFSVSLDNGKCWNQLSLIDTDIDSLSDVAVSPDCDVTYLATINTATGCGCDSVWMKDANATEYAGVWQRVYYVELGTAGLLRLSPEHDDGDVVYLGDFGAKNLYWAESKGICKWSIKDSPTIKIQDFALADDDILCVIDSGDGLVRWTEAKGDWSSTVDHKAVAGHAIVVLGDYVLVGGSAGSVGYSDDGADSFSRLGDKETLGSDGEVHVAFDSYFEDNDTVYAAVNLGKQGIWRWVIDDSTSWKDLKANPTLFQMTGDPEDDDEDKLDVSYFGIVLDSDNPMTDEDTGGVLYAVYEGGMARLLDPCKSPGAAKWDYLINGVPAGTTFIAEPAALKICDTGNSLLWAINTADHGTPDDTAYDLKEGEDNLFVYEDCLAKEGVELSEVEDGAVIASDPCYCWNDKFVLNWDDLCNSSTYELEIALDEDFDFTVDLETPNLSPVDDEYVLIPDETLDCNETYYWRVRVIKADSDAETIRSWWSDGWSFTVQAGPAAAIQLTAPESGATDVAIEGVAFTWTSVAAATSYDFALMDAAGNVVSSETGLTGTAYAYPGKLSYDTPYTWKVTTMKNGSVLSESSLSTFRTVPAAAFTCPQCGLSFPTEAALKTHIDEVHAPVEPTTPSWVWVVIGLGAVLVITIIVLIFRTRRV